MRGGISLSRLVIEGGKPLQGSLEISGGAKNSALAIIVAAALAAEGGESILENIPRGGSDITTVCEILQELGGAEASFDQSHRLHINGQGGLHKSRASYDLVRKMRASFYSAGLLLARLGRAEVPLPGGAAR